MSRTDRFTETQEITYHDDKIGTILKDLSVKEDKVVIADFDSLIHTAAYTGKDELGKRNPEYTEDQYEIAQGVLDDAILGILSKIEQYFNIKQLYICIKGRKKNFRKTICPEYKANRPPTPPVINHLCDYMIKNYNAITAEKEINGNYIGYEADDTVYSISKAINHQGIILYIDEDLLQIPSIFYNYKKDIWVKMKEKEAKHHLCLKLLQGDNGDNVKINKGLGPKTAQKIIHPEMSDFQYIKNIYKTYIQYNGPEKAKDLLKQTYKLLKLYDIENIAC